MAIDAVDALHIPDPTEPTVDDLQADEGYGIPFVTPVRVVGPVESHELPARGGSVRRWTVDGTALNILGEDSRRKRATVLSTDTPFYFAHTMNEVQANTAAQWPAGEPLHLSSIDPLYVRAVAPTEVTEAGAITTATGTNPAAGAEISETVPAGEEWELLAVRYSLTTSAVVATRASSLIIDNGTDVILRIAAASTQAASLTVAYNWMADLGYEKASSSANVQGSFPRLRLPAGYRIRTSTGAIDPGDDYTAPVLHYIRRTVDAALTELLVSEEQWAH